MHLQQDRAFTLCSQHGGCGDLQVDDAAGQLEFLVEVGASGVAAQPSQLLYLQALLAWHRGSNPAQVGRP